MDSVLKRIYLDANGSAPPVREALEIVARNLDLIGNPSSSHGHGRLLRALIDEAREHGALAVNARAKDIIFTSGASEANRLFVDALLKMVHEKKRPLAIHMSPYEHPSLYKPILRLHEEGAVGVTILELDQNGSVKTDADLLVSADVIIATAAHNETGILIDMEALARNAPENTLLMSDVSQALARRSPLPDRVDVLTFSAQKIGGLAGAGGMVLRGLGKKLSPPWLGGGQERGFRPGTESALMIAAFGAALQHIERTRSEYEKQIALRDHFEQQLKQNVAVKVLGEACARLPNTSAVCFLDEDPDALRIGCDLAGLSVGFGAACSGLAPEGSFALKRLGLSAKEERSTVRFSLCADTTSEEVDEAIERLLTSVVSRKF